MRYLILVICLYAIDIPVTAQNNLTVELRATGMQSNPIIDGERFNAGYSISGLLAYEVLGPISVYGGYEHGDLQTKNNITGSGNYIEESGVLFGLMYTILWPAKEMGFFINGGPSHDQLKLKNYKDVVMKESKDIWGWHLDLGVNMYFRGGWMARSVVHIKSISNGINENPGRLDASYHKIGIGVGLAKSF